MAFRSGAQFNVWFRHVENLRRSQLRELCLAFEEIRIVQVVAQVTRAAVEFVFVNQRKQLAHHLPVIASAGNDDELLSLSVNLSAIAIANTAAPSQRAHGLRFDSLEIVNCELLSMAEK